MRQYLERYCNVEVGRCVGLLHIPPVTGQRQDLITRLFPMSVMTFISLLGLLRSYPSAVSVQNNYISIHTTILTKKSNVASNILCICGVFTKKHKVEQKTTTCIQNTY